MNPEPLARAVIAAMLLLEHCGPEEVDPDTAVKGLENMTHELLRLTAADRSEFVSLLEGIADSTTDDAEARFILSIPFAIGFTPEA